MDLGNAILMLVFGGIFYSIIIVLLNMIPYFRMIVDVILLLALLVFLYFIFDPLISHGWKYFSEHIREYIFKSNDFSTCVKMITTGLGTIIGTSFGATATDSIKGEKFLKLLVFIDFVLVLIGVFFSGGLVLFGGILVIAIIASLATGRIIIIEIFFH
jgi:hypothetical protein